MGMRFTPRGNATDVCAGLVEFELSRPPLTQTLYDVNLGLFIAFVIIIMPLVVLMYVYRDHPRFAKVRPLYLSYLAFAFALIYTSGGTLAFALNWPCSYIMFAQCGGICLTCSSMVLRSMVIALEAQYAKTVVSNRIQANADHESTDEESHGKASSSVETVMSRLSQQCFAISLWSSVVFGRRKLATFSLREINIAKSSYALFTLFYVSPGAIIILVVLVAIPPLSLCNAQCHDMFLEMEIGILAVMGYFIIFCLKIVHIMYELVGFDDKGLMMEMSFIVIGGGVVILTKTGLAIGDPNDWDFDRVMNWQCLVFLIAGVNITITGWYQIGVAYSQTLRDRREDAGQEQANVIKMMIPLLENNPTLRKEFTEFGVKQYVVESIQFLEDVAQFKNLFYQKGDTWRAQKVNMLIKNYVKVGTDMEINISSAARDRILQRVKITKIDQASFDIFDEAYDQIKEMVQNGAWREFTRNRVMPSSPTIASSSSPISGLLASPSRKM